MPTIHENIDKVLITADQISAAVGRLAQDLRTAYENTPAVCCLILLEGARWFASDLLTRLNDPRFQVQSLKVSSYFGTTQSSEQVDINTAPSLDLTNRHVLILDDIYDTGRTLHAVIAHLAQVKAASIRTCVMFAKDRHHEQPVDIDFAGLTLPDRFVVGYGLDYQNRYRDLPYVGVLTLKQHEKQTPTQSSRLPSQDREQDSSCPANAQPTV